MTPLLGEKITFTSQGQQITLFPLYQLDGWTIRLAAYHQDFFISAKVLSNQNALAHKTI